MAREADILTCCIFVFSISYLCIFGGKGDGNFYMFYFCICGRRRLAFKLVIFLYLWGEIDILTYYYNILCWGLKL